jgi:ubiquinone/menaquinone biosynthesis C-methylase UbiE
MTDHFQQIYNSHADQYEAMVAREDYQGNLLKALENIRPLAGLDVVEFGAGTGRLTLMLAPLVKSIRAFDASQHMLDVTIAKLQQTGLNNWQVNVADNRSLPVDDHSADLAIEGWSFGHFRGWYPDTWREEMRKAVVEMKRILRPGGTAVLIETMGTGQESPKPPTPELAELFDWMQNEFGLSYTWIRTDYKFDSLEQADQLTRFFFGDEMADKVVHNHWVIVPECTGVWWRTF